MMAEAPRAPTTRTGVGSVARGASVTFFGHLAGRALGFLLTLILTRWLGASDFGLFILALTIFQCVSLVADVGLRYGALRFVAVATGEGDHQEARRVIVTVFRFSLAASLVVTVALGASAPLLAEWFRQAAFWWLIPVMALSLPFATVGTVLKSVLQAFRRLAAVAMIQNVLDPIARIGVFVVLAAMGWGVGAAAASHLAAAICVFGVALVWVRPLGFSESDRASGVKEKEILAFSVPLGVAHIASLTVQWADSLFLGYFTSTRDVGVFGAASRLAALAGMTLFAASMSFAPRANELQGRGDHEGVRQLYEQVTRWLIIMNLPILVLVVAFAPWLLGLFGAEFRAGSPALITLAAAILVMVATGPAGDVALMAGRSRSVMLVAILLAVLNIGLNWGLVPRWGVLGAAIATAVTMAVSNVTNVLLGWWFLGLQPYSAKLVKPLAIGGGAIFCTALIVSAVRVETGQGVVFFLLTWAIAYPLVLMRVVDPQDRMLLRSLLPWATPASWGER